MRLLLLIGFFAFYSNSYAQDKENGSLFTRFDYFHSDIIKNRINDIIKIDSTKKACEIIFNSYDKNDILVSQLKYNQCQSNTKFAYHRREIYDKNGKILL
ncbi:hypothetical protein [Mangrovivirga cuniculi]|uniref:Uncharacterized protein n=1 Tax=Mangrovivirga cuniculi TaxID=2715131 RepID=A0A4D7JHT2_9BACT|nr:hypothetical protein [Mangrovivirga cuniculi]QCK15579.1 hypothetical protein DCC35_12890 [Mangrovivirga cuniculi]